MCFLRSERLGKERLDVKEILAPAIYGRGGGTCSAEDTVAVLRALHPPELVSC